MGSSGKETTKTVRMRCRDYRRTSGTDAGMSRGNDDEEREDAPLSRRVRRRRVPPPTTTGTDDRHRLSRRRWRSATWPPGRRQCRRRSTRSCDGHCFHTDRASDYCRWFQRAFQACWRPEIEIAIGEQILIARHSTWRLFIHISFSPFSFPLSLFL